MKLSDGKSSGNVFKTLAYHLVQNDIKFVSEIQERMYVSESRFREHLELLLCNGYRFIGLIEAHEMIIANEHDEFAILLTFDDGYQNTIDIVMPILKEYRIPAAMSICGSYINSITRKNIDIHVSKDFAETSDIFRWIESGNEIMSHTYSHYKLTTLTSCRCREEIEKDFKVLTKTFGFASRFICYPFGSVNDEIIEIVKEFYDYGFVTDNGCRASKDNQYKMARYCVESNCPTSKLIFKLNDFYSKLER